MAIKQTVIKGVGMRNKLVLAGVCVTLISLTGCQHRWEEDPQFGQATRNLFAAQYVNPDAPDVNKTLPGLDGPAAAGSVQKYQSTFGGGKSGSSGSKSSSSASGSSNLGDVGSAISNIGK